MKITFIKILFVIITWSLLISCSKDNNAPVTKTISFTESEYILESNGTAFNLPIQVSPSGFTSDYIIRYEINGAEMFENLTSSQAPQLQINISQAGKYEIELISISTSDSQIGEVDQTNNMTQVFVASGRDPNGLKLLLLWEDTSNNDLDFFVTDVDTFTIDSSQGSQNDMEVIMLQNTEPDAEYRVFARNWQSVSDPIPYTVLATLPNGTINMFSGDVPNVGFQFNEVLKVQKTGNSYTYTHLVPSVPL